MFNAIVHGVSADLALHPNQTKPLHSITSPKRIYLLSFPFDSYNSIPTYDDVPQAAHKISHRQHLIEEAKKAYAAKLVADKAGGASAGM